MNVRCERRIGVVTDAGHPELRGDDAQLASAFDAQGAKIRTLAWGAVESECEGFDLFVVRTPWDYFEHVDAFLEWIDGLPAPVVNAPVVLRWNSDKRYLAELEERGVAQIPRTVFLGSNDRPDTAERLFENVETDRAVVKPVVSGGAFRTRVVRRGESIDWSPEDIGGFMVQAFVPEIITRGEWSLMYFGGQYSHAVRKRAAEGDFRVQDDFGGTVSFEGPPAALHEVAERIVLDVPEHLGLTNSLPYARVDLVETVRGPLLMELELIEPELFFRADPASPGRFARAVLEADRSGADQGADSRS